jgi:hypothetical protein
VMGIIGGGGAAAYQCLCVFVWYLLEYTSH